MAKRIYEQYHPNDRVQIIFSRPKEDDWRPAIVLRAEPPGIWVRTDDGQEWFVTNTYRIRRDETVGRAS